MTKSPISFHLARAISGHAAKVPQSKRTAVLADDMENDEAEDGADNNPDRLKVLVDPDAQKLVMKIFQQYVSEEDYAELVMFIKDFDALLSKFRKGKPLTREEIEEIEEDVSPRTKKGKSADTMQMPGDETDDEVEEELSDDDSDDFEESDEEGDGDIDFGEDDEESQSVVIASLNGEKPFHEVIGAADLGLNGNLSIPLIGYNRKVVAAYEPKYDQKTGEFRDIPYNALAARLILAGYKHSKAKPDATGAYRVVAFGRGNSRIDVYSFGNDENRIVRAVILAGEDTFKVCNECTGGTAPACKANGKCIDQQAKQDETGPYA